MMPTSATLKRARQTSQATIDIVIDIEDVESAWTPSDQWHAQDSRYPRCAEIEQGVRKAAVSF